MVYIHGGVFTSGDASRYGAEYFMDEDVILITFQWRLGAFGFLNSGNDLIRGNMGFKDQVQMLQWTKSNIRHFGGDPDRVTIFGNSGGGFCVSMLMLSPMTTGLFHRAISQSGASACLDLNTLMVRNPQATVEEVGRVMDCDTQDNAAYLECLRNKPAADIALVRTPEAKYGLTVETHGNTAQTYMPDDPYYLLKNSAHRVPYIIGVVESEGAEHAIPLLQDIPFVDSLNERWTDVAEPFLRVRNVTVDQLLSVKEFYFGDKLIGNDTFREFTNLMSDDVFNHCVYVSAHLQSRHSTTYLYYLNKPPYLSYLDKIVKGFPAKEMGITNHGDELQYFFPYEIYPVITVDDVEYYEFSKYLVKAWATFARDGAPPEEWQPAVVQGSQDTFWFELNDKPGKTDVLTERMNLWEGFTHKQRNFDTS